MPHDQPDISIIDYGVGNLGSIRNMCNKLGMSVGLAGTVDGILEAGRLILPGVGAFDHGVASLEERRFVEPIRAAAAKGTPILGICLGMQLLGDGSEEGEAAGLGLIQGRCIRFRSTPETPIKVPHMGWNTLDVRRKCVLFAGDVAEWRFYFTHSYHFVGHDDDIVATATHGLRFTAAFQRGSVFGVQFHPEKSHRFGMRVLRNFGAVQC